MSVAILGVADQVILDKVRAGEMFTAYDVTREVRRQSPGQNVPHDTVKQEVHAAFLNGHMTAYDRTLAKNLGQPAPWIYHPVTADPDTYGQPQAQPAASLPGGMSTTNTPLPSTVQTGPDTYEADGRGTLCIPAGLLRAAGMTPGSQAYVSSARPGVLQITPALDPALPDLSTYTVDKYGNVRVTKAILDLAGLPAADYVVKNCGNYVEVTRNN